MNDPDPRAYEKLVDRLLASPHYGERWGRHWLDVVRFGESEGYETNMPRPNAWPYRDYVIGAFNRDTPFPRFVLEQLAGDTLADAPGSRGRHRIPRRGHARHRRQPDRRGDAPAAGGRPRRHHHGHGHRLPRTDDQLRPLPRPQVRPDHPARLLRPPGGLRRSRPWIAADLRRPTRNGRRAEAAAGRRGAGPDRASTSTSLEPPARPESDVAGPPAWSIPGAMSIGFPRLPPGWRG